EAILGFGPDGICTFCNPSSVRMLGYASADDVIGRDVQALLHPGDAAATSHPAEECPIGAVFPTGKGSHSDEEVLSRGDGSTFASECWGYPVRQGGKIIGIVVTFLDITDRKRAEDEIKASVRRREEFLAMLSHELRNPLA